MGAIIKLIEQGQGPYNGMGATMNMMSMHQMERINKKMDNRDKWEAKERMKERKHWQNQ